MRQCVSACDEGWGGGLAEGLLAMMATPFTNAAGPVGVSSGLMVKLCCMYCVVGCVVKQQREMLRSTRQGGGKPSRVNESTTRLESTHAHVHVLPLFASEPTPTTPTPHRPRHAHASQAEPPVAPGSVVLSLCYHAPSPSCLASSSSSHHSLPVPSPVPPHHHSHGATCTSTTASDHVGCHRGHSVRLFFLLLPAPPFPPSLPPSRLPSVSPSCLPLPLSLSRL